MTILNKAQGNNKTISTIYWLCLLSLATITSSYFNFSHKVLLQHSSHNIIYLFIVYYFCWYTVQLKHRKPGEFWYVFSLQHVSVVKHGNTSSLILPHPCTQRCHFAMLLSFYVQHTAELERCYLNSYPLKFSSPLSERWWWCSPSKPHFHTHPSHCIINNQNGCIARACLTEPRFRKCMTVSFLLWQQTADYSYSYRLEAQS